MDQYHRPRSRRSTRSYRRLPGFTLIEILVVVAIIALLVAILIPSLAKVRWQAKNVACKANLHDLGAAFNIYTATYRGGYFPITWSPGADSFYSLLKARLLRDRQILICPATRNVIREETLHERSPWREGGEPSPEDSSVIIPFLEHEVTGELSDIDHTAYGGREDSSGGHSYENNAVYNGGSHPLANHHKRTSHFQFAPHNMMLVHDNDDEIDGNEFGCQGAYFGGNNCPQPWDNHGEKGINMMFGDGHAMWVKKFAGNLEDVRAGRPGTVRFNENASIDRVWMRSQYPWRFTGR